MTPLKARAAHDHQTELKRLNRIKGQVEGIERMILEKRYCLDIVNQIKAARSALKSLEVNIIEAHLHHCVKVAIQNKNTQLAEEKIEEIITLIHGHGL